LNVFAAGTNMNATPVVADGTSLNCNVQAVWTVN
jgi:hypothetical protein